MRWLPIVALIVACSKEPSYESNFASVQLGESIADARSGKPFSGRLIARDRDIATVARRVLGDANFEHAKKIDTTGLVLVMPVDNGAPHGVARLLVDLNARELHPEVARRSEGALLVARATRPTLPLAEATFVAGKLDGAARLFSPGKQTTVVAELEFRDHVIHGTAVEYFPGTKQKLRELRFEHGVQTGPARWYWGNGELRAQATYANGKPVGKHESWYPNKQRKSEIVYEADGTVRETSWYSNGRPKGEPPDGVIEEFHGSGKPASRTTYAAGVKHGEARRWYPSGQEWESATYEHGVLVGPYRKWWKNGKPAHVYAYEAGKLHGDYRQYYDNGAKWVIARYEHGRPVGKVERWFRDGKLGYVMNHDKGRPHGEYRRWWPSGKPRLEATYVNGQLDGELKNWLEDGSVYEFATYERGAKVKTTRPQAPAPSP